MGPGKSGPVSFSIGAGAKMTTPSFRRLNLTESRAVCDFLDAHVEDRTAPDGPKMCAYKDGWNDQKVADELSKTYPGITHAAVSHRRTELHGKIFVKPKPEPKPKKLAFKFFAPVEVEQQVADLETRIARIENVIERWLNDHAR